MNKHYSKYRYYSLANSTAVFPLYICYMFTYLRLKFYFVQYLISIEQNKIINAE